MTDEHCAIDAIADPAGPTVYLYLRGEFRRPDHRELRLAVRAAFRRSRHADVVIDVADVVALAGECVDVLLVGYTRAMRGGHGYEVVNARGEVRSALEATGLCAREPATSSLYVPAVADVVELAAAGLHHAGRAWSAG